jgi:translation initiation factor IF-1
MSREDFLSLDGVVTAARGNGFFLVKTEKFEFLCRVSGWLRHAMQNMKASGNSKRQRIIAGDKVTVEVSPYDMSKGLIVGRERTLRLGR